MKTFGILLFVVVALVLLNSDHPPKPVAASPSQATFDYGDGFGKAPERPTEPVPAFEATPPRGAVGATPVIDGLEAVAQTDVSAFEDVPLEPVPARKEPVAAVPPVPTPEEIPAVNAAPSAFSDVPRETVVSSPVASAPGSGVDFTKNIFDIRVVGNNYTDQGTAVSVAPDTLLTVHHVARFANAQIAVNGQWVNAAVTHPTGADDAWRDGAIVKVQGGNLPVMNVRAPVYYEPVTVYGLKTKTKMRGFVSAARYVSLLPEAKGIERGDSGGAVVADDGSLVGLISGNEGQILNVPPNTRVVAMTRADYLLPYVPKRSATQPVSSGIPKPVGSAFPDGQPSAFDPPPAVNSNRANCSTPVVYQAPSQTQYCDAYGNCTVPQSTNQVQYRRGLFGIMRPVRVQ